MNFPIPPQTLRFMAEGEREFLQIGDGLLKTIQAVTGGLGPATAIVDIGSGYGRLAHALLRSGFQGTYHGLEILRPHTEWAQQNLGNDRFRFSHLDIRNGRYNPNGRLDAGEVRLQTHAARCDLIVLTSVFTHMYESEIENYLTCFSEMLQPGGQVVCTFFLLDAERRQAVINDESKLSLPYIRSPVARYHNSSDPLHAIAFERDWVETAAHRSGLLVKSISYGHWCDGRPKVAKQYQDFVVLNAA
jgi:SAM-dependent methyltransferase